MTRSLTSRAVAALRVWRSPCSAAARRRERARRRQGRLPQRRRPRDRRPRSAARPDASSRATRATSSRAAPSAPRRSRPPPPAPPRCDAGAVAVAPQALGAFRIERLGNERWLSTTLPPEQSVPAGARLLEGQRLHLVQDRADAGVLETDWAENRAKLPQDIIRSTIGKVFDWRFSTGELDKFRTRVERTADRQRHLHQPPRHGRGLHRRAQGQHRLAAAPGRPAARSRVPVAPDGQARRQGRAGRARRSPRRAPAPAAPARARIVEGQPTPTLQVDDGFDRAWRRVGLALDRSGFTVEDRDRAPGPVLRALRRSEVRRHARSPASSRACSASARRPTTLGAGALPRLGQGRRQRRAPSPVLDRKGEPETGDAGKRIVSLLLDDLK